MSCTAYILTVMSESIAVTTHFFDFGQFNGLFWSLGLSHEIGFVSKVRCVSEVDAVDILSTEVDTGGESG